MKKLKVGKIANLCYKLRSTIYTNRKYLSICLTRKYGVWGHNQKVRLSTAAIAIYLYLLK
ncbi:hypothetical protein KRE43_12140 [Elizabethkingia meningoseptica]|uniref:hypothetical protein n=1 Tax=Elizabethkingia TaxID=308865 RepID=UPI0010565768|nr:MULTISPECIES: hypothetical protein [Elizabethkingia]MDE5447463.1 hypothetical protein [Elizabethkingia meningoseptica]MDE5516261.1 hypothetical protein [Elizabethkingia meningoseptica]MDE5522531.1 hypothetical protein [Elizabethkingia meningoseptica]MDE5530571.1 hypothetical protein [Elizabethkingia meningoseptica]MDE5534128.1 hypothetical protein [Elizabethkingia meningoseptica]